MCFLGYPHGQKGYKLSNLDTKQHFVSQHVVFHETVFPFLNNTHTASSTDPYFLNHWTTFNDHFNPSDSLSSDHIPSPHLVPHLSSSTSGKDVSSNASLPPLSTVPNV